MGIDSFYGTDQPPERPRALDFPPEGRYPEGTELPRSKTVDMTRVRQTFERMASKYVSTITAFRSAPTVWPRPAFGSQEAPIQRNFQLPLTTKEKQSGERTGVDYGGYSAIFVPVSNEAAIKTAYEKVTTPESQKEADRLSFEAWQKVRESDGFKDEVGRTADYNNAMLVTTLPPTPDTQYKTVVFFLKPYKDFVFDGADRMSMFDYSDHRSIKAQANMDAVIDQLPQPFPNEEPPEAPLPEFPPTK